MADLTAEIAKTSKAFEEGRKGLSKEFNELLGSVREVNTSLGDSFLELRKQQKDSFVGALQTNKTRKLLKEFEDGVLSSRGELRQILERDLPQGFKSADEFFKTFDESNQALSNVSKDRLESEQKISELNKKLITAKAEGNQESAKTVKAEIDAEKALLDAKILTYDEIEKSNAELVDAIKESSEKAIKDASSKFEKFDSGLQELFGFGVGGFLDTLIAKTNAIGNLFGKDNLGTSIVDAIVQGFDNIGGGFFGGITEGATAAAVGDLADRAGGVGNLKDDVVGKVGNFFKKEPGEQSAMDKILGRKATGFAEGSVQYRDAQSGQFLPDEFRATDMIGKFATDSLDNIKTSIGGGIQGLKDAGSSVFEGAKGLGQRGVGAVSDFGGKVKAKGLGPMLSDGLDSAMTGFGNTMKNTASTVNKGFGGMLRGISVGFKGLTTSIGGLMSGIGAGIATMGTFLASVLAVVAPLLLKAALLLAVIYGFVKLMAYLDDITGGALGESIDMAWTAITDFFGSIIDVFTGEQTAGQALGNVAGAIADYATALGSWIGNLVKGLGKSILPNVVLRWLGWDEESEAIKMEEEQEENRLVGERESRRSDQQLENAAMESGLLAERNRWGYSKLDMGMISTAPTSQLQALARLDDFDEETTAALREELARRANFMDADRLGLGDDATAEQVARKRYELGEITEDTMNEQIALANNNQNVITNNNNTTIQGEQTTRPPDHIASAGYHNL